MTKPFDFSTMTNGMAFTSLNCPLCHYVGRDMEGNAVFDFSYSGRLYEYSIFGNDHQLARVLTRDPSRDIKIKP